MADAISRRSIIYEILMDFQKGNTSIAATEKKLQGVTKQTDTFRNSVGRVGAALGATFAVSQLISFTKQMTKLGDEVLDVRKRFQQINQSGALLGNLRKDTQGLIDDLSLMKSAVKAENFRIPLGELGKLLEFARKRANDTGQSVERMTELIVEGVGKKSVRSMGELGISASELNKELAKTPDFAEAVGNIAEREFARAKDGAVDYGDEIERLEVKIKNATQNISTSFTEFFGGFAKGVNDATDSTKTFVERIVGLGDAIEHISPGAFLLEKIFGTPDVIETYVEKQERIRKNIEGINRAIASGGTLFNSGAAGIFGFLKNNAGEAQMTIGEMEEKIKELQDSLRALPKDDALIPVTNKQIADLQLELDTALGKIKEVKTETKDAMEEYLKWIDEQEAIYGKQNEQADAAIARGRERNEVIRDEIDLQNKINANNEEMAAFDADNAKDEDITAETDAIKARNDAMLASLQIFQSIGQLAGKQKAAALASIAINQAIAISEAVKDAQVAGVTPIEKFAIYAAMFAQILGGIAQAKSVLSQAQGFAEGVIDIKGAGSSKSDSIPARLSRGESVMTAEETDEHSDVLWAIRKGNFDDFIQKNFVMPAVINKQFEKSTVVRETGLDYSQRFYQQLLATGEGNYYTKSGLKYLKSIDRKLSQTPSRYARS